MWDAITPLARSTAEEVDAVTARMADVDELNAMILPTGDLDENMAEEVLGVNNAGTGR